MKALPSRYPNDHCQQGGKQESCFRVHGKETVGSWTTSRDRGEPPKTINQMLLKSSALTFDSLKVGKGFMTPRGSTPFTVMEV